jgi:hypothetical protein
MPSCDAFSLPLNHSSVVLVDERLFFDVKFFGTVILVLFRAKVLVILTLFSDTLEAA